MRLVLIPVSAAEISLPPQLSFADAVSIALYAHPNIKQAEDSILTAQSRLDIEGLDMTYGVGSQAFFDHNSEDSILSSRVYGDLRYRNLFGTEASLELSPFGLGNERGSIGLTVRQPLIRGRGELSRQYDLVERAKTELNIQTKQSFRQTQAAILGVARAYFRAALAREQVKIQESALQLVEESAEFARKRVEARIARGIDVYRAEVQVAQTRDRLNLQRESARAALDRLMLAIGLGVGLSVELTDPIPDIAFEMPTLDEAIEKALANRIEIAVYDERLANQQRRLAMVEDEFRLGVAAVARFRSTNSGDGIVGFDGGHSALGVEMSVPLDRRAITAEKDIAQRGAELLEDQKTYQKEVIAEEVRSAFRARDSATTSLEIYSQNIEVAKLNLHIAERMVEEGEGDNRDVLSAQESLTNLERGIISAETDFFLSTLELQYAMGEDLTYLGSK